MRRPPRSWAVSAAGTMVVAVGLLLLVSRTGSSGESEVQGDVDCNTTVNSVDALQVLRYVAQLPATADCLAVAGDTNCDARIDAVDSLRILRHVALLANLVVPGCALIDQPLQETSTPSPTVTVSPAPGGSATPLSTITPTPEPGGYRLAGSGIATSWDDGLDLALIPDAPGEALIARQNGEVWKVFLDGSPPVPFGDLGPILKSGGEQGLLSIAFSPQFASDARLYVYYTRGAPGPSVLSRFLADADGIDEASETVILEVPQPYANHNGGKIIFGQDGYLYLSLGDGGSGGDPHNNAQNKDSLLGKVLRLDVTGQDTYGIPPDNPFVAKPGRDEVYAYGLRNPWRMSQDRVTGDIWLGDVGQNAWEEVDKLVRGGNFGWRCYEGFAEYNTDGCPDPSTMVFPRTAYPNPEQGKAVVGGYVYRGDDLPELYGHYLYADTYSGRIWAVSTTDDSGPIQLIDTDEFIYSFAELPDGELLVLTASGIYRLARA